MIKLLEYNFNNYRTFEWKHGTNPKLRSIFNVVGTKTNIPYLHKVDDSDISWCAIYVAYILIKNNLPLPKKPLAARSYLQIANQFPNIFKFVEKEQLQFGDFVIMSRGGKHSWKGHITQIVNVSDNYILGLGGNQSDMVKISKYTKSRILGGFRLSRI